MRRGNDIFRASRVMVADRKPLLRRRSRFVSHLRQTVRSSGSNPQGNRSIHSAGKPSRKRRRENGTKVLCKIRACSAWFRLKRQLQPIHKTMIYREQGQLQSAGDSSLVEDTGQVMLDSLLAQRKFLSNFTIRTTGHDCGDHLQLTGR
jgi:hypothetical protein